MSLLVLCVLTPLLVRAQDQTLPIVPVEVRVMTFNIWVGGELVDFSKVIESIQAAKADIVGLQEPTTNTKRIAEALGWQYASERMHIISRFPLIDPPGGNGNYIYAQIVPGQVIALSNVHLTSDPYGPDAVKNGDPVDKVLELEQSTRMPDIEPVLASLAELVKAGVPVFLTGDFNSPSNLDWTEAVTKVRPQVKYPVEWPESVAVQKAGFVDTFRAANPDPVKNPGITWTYGYPYPRLKPNEVQDRIDFVYAANAIETVSSQIVGPLGSPNVDIGIQPYPSDHRSVVSDVKVLPVVPPLFVAAQDRRVVQGELLVVRFHAPDGEDSDRIVIVPEGGKAADSGIMWLPPYETSFFGSVTFGTGALKPGAYEAVLTDKDQTEVSRSLFWVVERNAVPTVKTEHTTYKVGDSINVSWQNTAAMRNDWVGIYAAGEQDIYGSYIAYIYTKATVNGTGVFDKAVIGDDMLPAGDYVVRLLADDGYSILAESPFTVTAK